MTLHIRDFRQSDAAGLTRLAKTAYGLGAVPGPGGGCRILTGVRGDELAGAVWLSLEQGNGVIDAVLVAPKDGWQSDVQELIAEANLWFSSRGAARIEVKGVPEDKQLLARLFEMHFKPDDRSGLFVRLLPARSAA